MNTFGENIRLTIFGESHGEAIGMVLDGFPAGEDIDIRVTVENTGDVTLTEVVVSDPNAPGCAGPVDDIAAGDDVTVECTVTTPPGMEGHYFNAATVDTHETDPVTSSTIRWSPSLACANGTSAPVASTTTATFGVSTGSTSPPGS